MREDLIKIARRKLYRVGRYVGNNPGWRIESRFKDPNSKWMPLHGSALYTSEAKALAAFGRLMCLIEDRPLPNVKIQLYSKNSKNRRRHKYPLNKKSRKIVTIWDWRPKATPRRVSGGAFETNRRRH